MIRRFGKVLLAVFVALSAFLTIDVAMNLDVWGVLKAREYAAFTLIGGWSLTPDQLYIGISRLLYPFFMGLLLSRIGKKISVKGGFWWCSLFVMVILAIPCVGKEEFGWVNGLYCTVSVLVLFPIIVMMGAGSPITDKKSIAWCKWLGAISYPLYITHYPLMYMQMDWAKTHSDLPTSVHVFVGISIFLLSIGLAYASLKLYDEPVREWLKNHWLQPSKNKDHENRSCLTAFQLTHRISHIVCVNHFFLSHLGFLEIRVGARSMLFCLVIGASESIRNTQRYIMHRYLNALVGSEVVAVAKAINRDGSALGKAKHNTCIYVEALGLGELMSVINFATRQLPDGIQHRC